MISFIFGKATGLLNAYSCNQSDSYLMVFSKNCLRDHPPTYDQRVKPSNSCGVTFAKISSGSETREFEI